LIETVISFKDELIILAGVIGTVFLANKIAAGVAATIALIKSLSAAYAALRNTALGAAIASRFAVNPFLGLASAAAIAAAIYGATKIFGDDDSTGDLSTGAIPFASGFGTATGGGTTGSTGGTTRTGGTATGGTATGGTGSGGVSAVVSNAATVTKKAEQVVTDIAGAFDNFTSGTTTLAGINAASNRPFWAGTSGVNTNTLAGIMAASNAPTINLTVNGAMDAEGTARTIVDTLNNSYYRGTGGGTNLQMT
jgi:hypothetical protein